MSKEQWIEEVFQLLCKSQGAETELHRKNLRDYAENLADPESGYFQEGMNPQEAHDEELSCA
jgi:hypothetical protein